MTYIYTKLNESWFSDRFDECNRSENFSMGGRRALFEYLEQRAEELREPIEMDVIVLCDKYSEYADLAEFNRNYGSSYDSLEEIKRDTTAIKIDHNEDDGPFIAGDF